MITAALFLTWFVAILVASALIIILKSASRNNHRSLAAFLVCIFASISCGLVRPYVEDSNLLLALNVASTLLTATGYLFLFAYVTKKVAQDSADGTRGHSLMWVLGPMVIVFVLLNGLMTLGNLRQGQPLAQAWGSLVDLFFGNRQAMGKAVFFYRIWGVVSLVVVCGLLLFVKRNKGGKETTTP